MGLGKFFGQLFAGDPKADYIEVDDPFEQPWVVVDCEMTGFDEKKDVLLSIAAVKMRGPMIEVGESFHRLLRPKQVSSTGNVLIHGIGHEQQNEAADPADVLTEFRDFVGKAPMIGYHAGFDAKFLRAAFDHEQIPGWQPLVIDCAVLLPLMLAVAQPPRELDKWLDKYEIEPLARHDALSDAWCTAQLWQILQTIGQEKNCTKVSDWVFKIKQAREAERMRM